MAKQGFAAGWIIALLREQAAEAANQCRSVDFQHDLSATGQGVRTLNAAEEPARGCLARCRANRPARSACGFRIAFAVSPLPKRLGTGARWRPGDADTGASRAPAFVQ